jgi:hypothetical protein
MRFESMERRVVKLESEVYGGWIATTDDVGRRMWVTGSGLHMAFRILKIQHDLSKEGISLDALPIPLCEEVSLWSRAETEGQGQAAAMIIVLGALSKVRSLEEGGNREGRGCPTAEKRS